MLPLLKAGLTLSDVLEMCGDEVELWREAIDAQSESEFQEKMQVEPLYTRHDRAATDARRNALRASKYRWHDKLRIDVDLRRM